MDTLRRQNSMAEEKMRHLVGQTHGMLRSVIEGGSDIFSGISSKLESALSLSSESSESQHAVVTPPTPSKDSACELSMSALGEHELQATGPDPYDKFIYKIEAYSSESAGSSRAGYGPSTSLELSGPPHSGSDLSVSSLSADGPSEEAEARAFMRTFVNALFDASESISLDQKAEFGRMAQTELGRVWFARLVNAHRSVTKCVSESTFFSLVQHFAIVLFECAEADHVSPAKTLMNMCFTFYYEVQVPGCEPFKEYLSTYLKDQAIWRSLRYWNAAFFDALQCERLHRPVVTREEVRQNRLEAITDERQYQENITFGQLGTFTCNMHAFGLEKDLCMEFLRKQCSLAALAPEQEKMLHENVDRMYAETDPWR